MKVIEDSGGFGFLEWHWQRENLNFIELKNLLKIIKKQKKRS